MWRGERAARSNKQKQHAATRPRAGDRPSDRPLLHSQFSPPPSPSSTSSCCRSSCPSRAREPLDGGGASGSWPLQRLITAAITGLDDAEPSPPPIGPRGRCPAGGGAGSAGDAGAGDVCASGQGRGSRVDHGGALAGRPVGRSARGRGAVGPCEVHVRQGRHQQDAGAGSASAGDVCAPGFAPRSFFAGFSPSLPQPWLLGDKPWGEDDADPSRGYDRGFRAADGDCPRAAPSRDSGRKRQGGGRRGCRLRRWIAVQSISETARVPLHRQNTESALG